MSDGRHRRGVPRVPGELVAFCALMLLFFGAFAVQAWHRSQTWPGTIITDGTVIEVHEPKWFDKGSGSAVVRYVVNGTEYTFKTPRDPGDHFLRLNDALPVEYTTADPTQARAVWATQAAHSDLKFLSLIVATAITATTITATGYLIGRRRVRLR